MNEKPKLTEQEEQALFTPLLPEEWVAGLIENEPVVTDKVMEELREDTPLCPHCGSSSVVKVTIAGKEFSVKKATQLLYNSCLSCKKTF